MKTAGKFIANIAAYGLTGGIIGVLAMVLVFKHYSKDLPDYSQLAQYDPPTVTRLYSADGKLLAEYAKEKRVFVPLSAIPKRLIQAFLSAEDKNFYEHSGVDITGVARAVVTNLQHGGKSVVGGSTITQQVVKNFLLTSERTFERKIKEAILALRISTVYSKDKILELYLNEIYLGMGSYGVAAASLNYFNKSLDELTIEEAAFLASLPKAPANYDPRRHYERAKTRRDFTINRMLEDGHVTAEEAKNAINMPITLRDRDHTEIASADFFAEEVRRKLAQMYGGNALYQGGLTVKTTLDPALQSYADHALRNALIAYDKRHGYRGPLARLDNLGSWEKDLSLLLAQHKTPLFDDQSIAVVLAITATSASIGLPDGASGVITLEELGWARKWLANLEMGPAVTKVSDVLSAGDVVLVMPKIKDKKQEYSLFQIPRVNGAMMVMDPHTGRVLAMSGGYSYGGTEFNRATQAKRQPGSSFKPFVYLSGMEAGFTPSSMVLDAPVEMSQGAGLPTWKPQNYHDQYYGPTTLRVGLEKSRNTMTVRLAQMLGIERVIEVGERFGIYDKPPRNFSIVLGAAETTLLKITNAYAMLVNGGKRVTPALIERIDDRHGKIIYRRDARTCEGCVLTKEDNLVGGMIPPIPPDDRPAMVDPRVAYQMVSMMQGVVERGTATKARAVGKPLAGKTGTTNDSLDTWFVGFSPDLVAGVFIGFDRPQSLGKKETGGSVSLPAFVEFMSNALKGKPATPFRVPPGIQLTKVDIKTGQFPLPGTASNQIIYEAFRVGGAVVMPAEDGNLPATAIATQPLTGDIVPPDPALTDGSTEYLPPATNMDEPERVSVPYPEQQDMFYASPPTPAPTDNKPEVVGTGGLY